MIKPYLILVVVCVSLAIMISILYANSISDKQVVYPCKNAKVIKRIHYLQQIDSTTTKDMRDYHLECNDGTTFKITPKHNLPVGGPVQLQWRTNYK